MFVLQADGKTFNGFWSEPGGKQYVAWTGAKAPEVATETGVPCRVSHFAGCWATTQGGLEIDLQLSQDFVGEYGNGHPMKGRISRCELSGEWSNNNNGRGTLRFVLQPDGQAFSGSWSQPGALENVLWTGKKQRCDSARRVVGASL
jgi:hypothetical protein